MASNQEAQDEQFPLAAQIPLDSFTLPTFPPAASQLRALTLTSDINLNDYQSKHLQPGTFEPSTTLPPSITHLTLELFSLGFQSPFLTEIAKRLPNLQSLTLFSCLIDGLSDTSRKDALTFFKTTAPTLRELHIVDTFARVGFWKEVGEIFSSASTSTTPSADSDAGLKVLEVSYTYRGHNESDFLNRTAGDEWSTAITPSLIGVSLNFSSPPDEDSEASMQAEKPEDQEELKAQDGILPFASDGRASLGIRQKFEALSARKDGSVGLKVLNLSMYSLRPAEVGEIVYTCAAGGAGGLAGLTVSVLLEEKWLETLSRELAHKDAGKSIESLEIIGVPVAGGDEVAAEDVEKLLMKSKEGMETLAKSCPSVERFEMSILKSRRIGNVVWEKESGAWTMHRDTRTGA